MARVINNIRKVNAKLGEVNITRYGKTWAIQYGFDGASIINNEVPPVPTDIKEYLEGNDNITVFACASNIDKLCEYALASFPSIEDLYLFKTSAIVVLEDDLSYLLDLNKIYVPSDLLSAYISAYPTLSSKFDTIVEDYTLTIPFVGDTRLTSEYVDSVISMLSNAEKNAITKIVIPTDFSSSSANDIAWGYDFSAIVNLDNNIWYGDTKYDFTTYTIQYTAQDNILTASVVSASVNNIPTSKLTAIEKIVVPVNFTSYASGSITELQAFMNTNGIDKLVTTYADGEIELSLSGDIVAKINTFSSLDNALVECRTQNNSHSNIIFRPTSQTYSFAPFSGNTNLVLVNYININNGGDGYYIFSNNSKLVEANIICTGYTAFANYVFGGGYLGSLKRLNMDFTNAVFDDSSTAEFVVQYCSEKIILKNYKLSIKYNTYQNSRQVLLDLINSLGTPTTTKTLTFTGNGYYNLLPEDIAIATAKNWNVVKS